MLGGVVEVLLPFLLRLRISSFKILLLYGRQREDAKDENAIPYYYTLASSMKELEFLYVIKNKCEESFCCSGEGGKIDKKNVDAEDYKCWMSVMAYTLWTNIMV